MKIFASLTVFATIFLSTECMSYKHHVTLKSGVFDVYWMVNKTDFFERFYFKFVAKTTGWAAFGWTTNPGGKNMINNDIALGGVRNGNITYLNDYWSDAIGKPTLDNTAQQSLTLTNAVEDNGFTTIEFNRKANTGETADDTALRNGTKTWLVWAIATADATGPDSYSKHNEKGHTEVAYNMYTGETFEESTDAPTSAPTQPSQPTQPSAASDIRLSVFVLFLVHLAAILMFNGHASNLL